MAKAALASSTVPVMDILLVEDNAGDAFVINSLLEDATRGNCKIQHCKTHAEAMRTLAGKSFDVCLLDLSLPDSSDFSALISIQEKTPDMPVLILTGSNDRGLARRAVGRGAQDYLLKDEIQTASLQRSIDYAMERKQVEKALFQRANHDPLTGLSNRQLFERRLKIALARAERSGSGLAVMVIDLDRFKPINDKYGHEAGDEALKVVAERMQKVLRPYDTAARLGGDEFAVLAEDVALPRDAANIAKKLSQTFTAPIPYQNKMLDVGASIGIAFTDTPTLPEVILQHADSAMYHAKEEGSVYRFYAPEMQHAASARLKMEDDLRAALSADEFRLHYQPYVTPDGEAVLGVEALLRWRHPECGLVYPRDFLKVAEESRLMPEIGERAFSLLRRDLAMWNAYSLPPMEVAINISASQLDAPGFIHLFAPLASKDFLGEHRLVVEIAGDVVGALSESRAQILKKMHALGVELTLDHFGRASISLETLRALPFSLLKLDLSLVQRIKGEASGEVLVHAAIELAHHLGMKAAAVGMEMPWQMQMLTAHRCDAVQGFLVSRPMTAEQLVEWAGSPMREKPLGFSRLREKKPHSTDH